MARRTLSLGGALKTDKRLDIYIDSCSMQPEVLDSVDKLIQHTQDARPQIYTSYRIIVPAMVNIEANRVLFPELQDIPRFKSTLRENDAETRKIAENATKNHAFFQKHREHLVTPETVEAAAWRALYIKRLPGVLKYQEDYPELLVRTAEEIAKVCNIQTEPFALEDIQNLVTRIQTMNAPRMREDMNDEEKLDGIKRLAAATEKFSEGLSAKDRCIIQASYLVGGFKASAHKNRIFDHMTKDAGENAIAAAITGLPDEEADKTTSLVISDDIGARRTLRNMPLADEKAPIVITHADFLKSAQSSFAPERASQVPASEDDWQTRVTIKTTEDIAKFDHSSVGAFTQAMRTGKIDTAKIRVVDTTGHSGQG